MKISRGKLYQKFILFSLVILLLQYFIGLKVAGIDSFDEIFTIFLICVYFNMNHFKIKYQDCYFLISILIVVFLGIISNILSGVCTNIGPIIVDCLSVVKIYIVYFVIYKVSSKNCADNILKKMYPVACIYIIFAFIGFGVGNLSHISYFFKDESAIRYGIKAYSFIAANAGNFGYLIIGLFVIIQYCGRDRIRDNIIKLMTLFLLLMTTKGPQMLFVAIWCVFVLLHTKRVKVWHIAVVGILGIVIGRYQIVQYFLNKESARFILLSTAVKIAKKYFPFGAGFATFGSEMSRRYYSPLYNIYGINGIYGLSKEFGGYITDNYWPMLIAELGCIGTIVIGLLLFRIFRNINKTVFFKVNVKWALLALFVTFLVGSLGSSYYNTATGMFCFTIVALVLKSDVCIQKG